MWVCPSQYDVAEKSWCENVHAEEQKESMSGGISSVDVEQCELMIAFFVLYVQMWCWEVRFGHFIGTGVYKFQRIPRLFCFSWKRIQNGIYSLFWLLISNEPCQLAI